MNNPISENEWKLAESAAENIKKQMDHYYLYECLTTSDQYVEVEVFVPMTENINMTFRIHVPYEMMDEDNTVLLEYFRENIYPSLNLANEEYYAESIVNRDDDNEEMSLLDEPLEYLGEIATVGLDEKLHLRVQVNPDRNRIGNPYLKVFDSTTMINGTTKVVRLHFKDSDMEYHKDGFLDWKPNNSDLKRIISFLNASHRYFPKYTIWHMACYLWNYEYGLISDDMDKYFNGEYDESQKKHPSYVSSTQPIPNGWVYNPLRGKGKRA